MKLPADHQSKTESDYVDSVEERELLEHDEEGDVVEGEVSLEEQRHLATSGSGAARPLNAGDGYNDLEKLHHRWGHLSEGKIKKALRLGAVRGSGVTYDKVKSLKIRFCEDCFKGKMNASSTINTASDRVWEVLGKVGIDWKGEFPVRTQKGERGFLLLCDQRSGFVKAYLCKSRSQTLDCLKDFLLTVVKPAGAEWKVLQGDVDSAFISKAVVEWLMKKTIRLQLSAPYKHSQNGLVERAMQSVMNLARAAMSKYNTPARYWGYAVLNACDVLNTTCVPNKNDTMTPHEMIYKEKPDVSSYQPFYAPGVYHLSKEERKGKAWAYKAEACRYLGRDMASKNTCLVLKVRTGAVVSRKDCVFDEGFHTALRDSQLRPQSDHIWKYLEENPPPDGDEIDEVESSNRFDMNSFDMHDDDSSIKKEEDEPIGRRTRSSADRDKAFTVKEESQDLPYTPDAGGQYCLHYHGLLMEDWWTEYALSVGAEKCGAPIVLPHEPKTVKEALSGPDKEKWGEVIRKELSQLESQGVYTMAEDQHGHGMKVKMVLRVSLDNEFKVKYKARLVACGYSQVLGRDYLDTYSPTVATIVVNLVLNICDLVHSLRLSMIMRTMLTCLPLSLEKE